MLSARILGPQDAELTVVLLHGFGAPGDDLVPLGGALDQALGTPIRYVFPAAPIELGGMYGDGRAWWPLDLAKLEADLRTGRMRNRRSEIPEGLAAARASVLELVDGLAPRKLVLGGFSQGAMLALDVALHRDPVPAALILMSGTLVAEPEWTPRLARLANVPIMMSHGRNDPLLPFAISEDLHTMLATAGARVDWQPFAGGHEIPPPALHAAASLLRTL